MSITDAEKAIKDTVDKATYQRLEKDVTAVKNDIAALTDQITDAINTFAGAAKKQARHGYKQARASMRFRARRGLRARHLRCWTRRRMPP